MRKGSLGGVQFYLCGKQNKWLGLLLPGVFFSLFPLFVGADVSAAHIA